jgi:single-strand DNA-binding protein
MAVARFSVAIDRPVKQGQDKQTDFPSIVVFGKQAENCEKFLSKGKQVAIIGRLQTGSYTNKDGQKVYTTDVVASRVKFLEWGDKGSSGNNNTASAAPPPDMDIPAGFSYCDDDDDVPF